MGQAKVKQKNDVVYLSENPICCYCGDLATTVDHIPARSFFKNNAWPEGFRFPACQPCNAATRLDEMVMAVLARATMQGDQADDEFMKLVRGVRNNRSDIIDEWMSEMSRNQQRASFRRRFGNLGDGFRDRGFGHIHLGPLSHQAIDVFLQKLAKALFYKHVGKRLTGTIAHLTMDKATLDKDTFIKALDIAPLGIEMTRNRVDLSDQFIYRYNMSVEYGIFAAAVEFPAGQLLYMIMAADPPNAPGPDFFHLRADPSVI